LGGLGVDGEIS